MRPLFGLWRTLPIAALMLVVACGPAAPAQQAQPAAPKAAAPAEAPKPAAQPAAPVKSAAQPARPAAEVKKILIGSIDSSSSQYPYWVAVGKVINESVPTVNATVAASGGTVENINRAIKGEFDAFVWQTDAAFQAYRGLAQWKDKPFKDLRWLWIQRQTAVAFVVREDSGIKKLEDLNGNDFNAGGRGSATEKEVKDALEALGINPKWYVASGGDALQAAKDRRIVGFGKSMAGVDVIDAQILELATATKIRVLTFTPEQQRKVQDAHPYYPFTKIPPGVFKDAEWNKEPILTPGQVVGGGATTKLPEDVVYAIVKAIDQDQMPGGKKIQESAQKAIEKDFGRTTAEAELFTEPPLHAGAVKWYKERGLKIPDAIIPSEAKR